jgi:hypothetical protein
MHLRANRPAQLQGKMIEGPVLKGLKAITLEGKAKMLLLSFSPCNNYVETVYLNSFSFLSDLQLIF